MSGIIWGEGEVPFKYVNINYQDKPRNENLPENAEVVQRREPLLYCMSGEGLFAEEFEHLSRVLKNDQGRPWCMGRKCFPVGAHLWAKQGWREPASVGILWLEGVVAEGPSWGHGIEECPYRQRLGLYAVSATIKGIRMPCLHFRGTRKVAAGRVGRGRVTG